MGIYQINLQHIYCYRLYRRYQSIYGTGDRINECQRQTVRSLSPKTPHIIYRLNCDHWARLVTTGDYRCYQIAEFKKLQQLS
ncbi:hypothetical protein NDI44_04080 [Trichocoleus sp. DQ-A3]|uniref:hypothetical protein n=1 Tax=Cyanophyceae TaxID=3028117 RepID=UPI001689AEED|nr:hypothetical protein [Coleofasciculus sp. FACHB-125]MBD1900889.1 hypothetical protein [Coleofasciculus sp. FACHB-125]